MAQQYGRTWWGQQWLKSLDRIDFSNRLPRGKSYANNGKINDIRIENHVIRAKVKGTQQQPYDVSIVVPPFNDKEKKVLIQSIRNNPLVLSQLLNRHLPNELIHIAEQSQIKIFPKSWQDLKLNCSCPDWAVPCKHLAAVIYMVANEIDQNPFLVFSLHGVDLLKEMAAERLNMNEMEKEHIFSFDKCAAHKKTEKIKQVEKPEIPDFSIIEDLQSTLPLLFPASPLFYSTDFKTNLQNFYKQRKKTEPHYLAFLKGGKAVLPKEYRFYDYKFIFDLNSGVEITALDENKTEHLIDWDELLILIAQTESKHLSNYSASFVALYRTFRFCNILAERSALLPRLVKCENNSYVIQWIPAIINQSVKNIFDKVVQWYQPEMGMLRERGAKGKGRGALLPLDPEEGLLLFCSLFSGRGAEFCMKQSKIQNTKNENDSRILHLFFNNKPIRFNAFSEKEIPNTIQLWLKRFFIGKKAFSPVLQVHESATNIFAPKNNNFEVEVLMRDNNSPIQTMENLYSFMKRKGDEKIDALKNIQLLSHYMPELNQVIASEGRKKLNYTTSTFSEVLLKILPAIRMLGIQTLLPKSLQYLLKPKVTLALKQGKRNKSFFSLHETMAFDWKIAIGDSFIDPNEFKKLARKTSGLVKIRDSYVMMTKEEIERIIKKLESPETPSSIELLQAALSEDYNGASVHIDPKLKEQIKQFTKTDLVELPTGIHAKLRPYQHRGFSWMYKNAKLGLGSLLADDMGLGKTLQVITTLLKFRQEGLLKKMPSLVIAPTTLLSNWKSEISKFAPELRAEIYHGTNRKTEFKNLDVIITTYGVVRSDNERLRKEKWSSVIIDEAQNIKNNNVAQTKAVKKLQSNIKIAMSGTPVENRLSEYWSIFDFANPQYLGNETWFDNNYAQAIEINQDKNRLEKFLKITSPFILRRVKTDKSVISDLPDKIENNQWCSLSKEQAALYKNLTTDMLLQMESTDGIERKGLILKLLTSLKQICNHPAQYLKTKGLPLPDQSGKMLLLLQLLETIYENNEKVLIFSQYMEAGTLLQQVIHEHFGKKALQLHGGCSRKERDEMVKAFQGNPMYDTFILSLKAGGTGLNLTSANHVIHFDLWWNPAAEAQATDRAFRIGQNKNVMVHRLITKGTLEEKIDDMLKSKKNLANMTVTGGEKWVGELSDKEIKELVALAE